MSFVGAALGTVGEGVGAQGSGGRPHGCGVQGQGVEGCEKEPGQQVGSWQGDSCWGSVLKGGSWEGGRGAWSMGLDLGVAVIRND